MHTIKLPLSLGHLYIHILCHLDTQKEAGTLGSLFLDIVEIGNKIPEVMGVETLLNKTGQVGIFDTY